MRITDNLMASSFIRSLNKSKSEVQKLQKQISTNSKIQNPSDSPSGTAKILRLTEQLNNNGVYKSNIASGRAFVQTSVSLMESMYDRVQDVETLIVDINNPTNRDNMTLYADQVDAALSTILDLANSEFDGKYVFGGTYSGTDKPYYQDSTAVVPAGEPYPYAVVAGGTGGTQGVKISKNITQKINTTGTELFGTVGTSDIFNTLQNMREDIKNGIIPSSADTETVKKFGEKLLNKISSAGDVLNRLDDTEELITNQELELKGLISDEKDVDVAEAVIDLQNQQYYLDLSYKMSSMILPKSLLDFM